MATKAKRNTHAIGFNDEEYQSIVVKAKKMGLFPRQYLLLMHRRDVL